MRFIDCALEYLNKCSDELAPLTVRTYYWNLKKVELFNLPFHMKEQMDLRDFS